MLMYVDGVLLYIILLMYLGIFFIRKMRILIKGK